MLPCSAECMAHDCRMSAVKVSILVPYDVPLELTKVCESVRISPEEFFQLCVMLTERYR